MTRAAVASLSMYTQPEPVGEASQALIAGVFDRLGLDRAPTPTTLDQQWLHPCLLFAQTCGFPLITRLGRRVQLLARPVYTLDPCEPAAMWIGDGWHRSLIVVGAPDRRTMPLDFAGARAVINGVDSNTGMNLFRHYLARAGARGQFFSQVATSGSHRRTLDMIAAGQADIGAVDAITWAGLARHAPDSLKGVRVLDTTTASPTLPLITAGHTSDARRDAIYTTLSDVLAERADIRERLGLSTLEPATRNDYARVRDLEDEARDRGYPIVA